MHTYLHQVARKIGVSEKFGDLDVWGYLLNMKNNDELIWITVRDHENGLIYDGRIIAFSDDSRNAELLLEDVCVYENTPTENETAKELYKVNTMYLSRNREKITLEYRPWEDNNE